MIHSGLVCRLSRTCVFLLAMEFVIVYEYLTGTQNETVIKMSCENVLETFQFPSPYAMRPHRDTENGLNWDDRHIPYNQLSTVLSEAVAGFAHLYGYGDSKCTLLSQLPGRPVHNLADFNCPSPRHFRHKFRFTKPCHRNLSYRCAIGRAIPLRVANVLSPENVLCYLTR